MMVNGTQFRGLEIALVASSGVIRERLLSSQAAIQITPSSQKMEPPEFPGRFSPYTDLSGRLVNPDYVKDRI
jgi:hypothetical protein